MTYSPVGQNYSELRYTGRLQKGHDCLMYTLYRILFGMPVCCGRHVTRDDVCSRNCARNCCKRLNRLPTRAVCIVMIVLQSIALNNFLVQYDKAAYSWILADGLVLTIFIAAFVVSFKSVNGQSRTPNTDTSMPGIIGEMPLGFMAWAVYALVLVIRVAVIFKYMGEKEIRCADLYGANLLKAAIALSAVIFVLHIVTHHDATPHTEGKYYIEHIAMSVTLDILDTVDILSTLFERKLIGHCGADPVNPSAEPIPDFSGPLVDTIVGTASINLLLPTVPLIFLSRERFALNTTKGIIAQAFQSLVYVAVVNIPFFVLRMYMWITYKRCVSVFLVKNVIKSLFGVHDIYEKLYEVIHSRNHKKNGRTSQEPETATSEAMDIIELDDSPHANDVRDLKLKHVIQAQMEEVEKTGLHVTAL